MNTANLFQKEKDDFHYNACVGNNGWTGIRAYIHGYQAATLVMLESVLKSVNSRKDVPEDANYWYVDTAIYPILFSARHYIELYIKGKIHEINSFKLKKNIEDKLTRTHKINSLWDYFKRIVLETCDSRMNKFLLDIEPYINDFSEIDLTGETFRYPYNQDYTKKHLENQSLIGLYNFYQKFSDLSKKLTDFDLLTSYLYAEYQAGTYTKRLNREDIEYIAKNLPKRADWQSDEFDLIKLNIKERFKIGSKEFSQVIKIIEEHMEFKRYISPDIYDLQIEKDKLVNIINNRFSLDDLEQFNYKEISCIRTLVELGLSGWGQYHSEDYDKLFKNFLDEMENNHYERKSNYEYSIRHINQIKDGLKIIGYSSIFNIT